MAVASARRKKTPECLMNFDPLMLGQKLAEDCLLDFKFAEDYLIDFKSEGIK